MQMVSEVMTRNVQFVSPQETVQRAAQLMDDLNVGALPVCDGERLVGMVTDRDITVRATSAGIAPDEALVDEVMSTDVRWCFDDQPLDEVMQQMADAQIRRVPVISHDDGNILVGIVSLGDIATKAIGDDDKMLDVVEKISFPSEPDRSSQGNTSDMLENMSDAKFSDTGTADGLLGSDVLAEKMNPNVEVSATADPSDVVEVTPNDLVYRNAPGSALTSPDKTGAEVKASQQDKPVIRRIISRDSDTIIHETGTPAGIDAAGHSGDVAGTAGSAG
ncbi:MAG: CBS domain-containing protein, partial [Burkholderiaceae bacterium]